MRFLNRRERGERRVCYFSYANFTCFAVSFLILLLLTACNGEATTAVPTPTTPLILPDGFTAEVAVTGLSRPTQFIWGPDGRLWVAHLFAGENEGLGQVVKEFFYFASFPPLCLCVKNA